MNFLGISKAFCDLKYEKVTEFSCDKQSQGRLNDNWLLKNAKNMFRRWQQRWVVITSTNLMYYESPEDGGDKMRDSVPFDTDTIVTVAEFDKDSVTLDFILSRRTLRIRVADTLRGLIALHYVEKGFRLNKYARPHRFTSFAPIRENNDCTFYVNGQEYFKDVQAAIEKASQVIMITDWWFSPEMPLIRPIRDNLENEPSRIDKTLQRAA